jgi:hypothetical protein
MRKNMIAMGCGEKDDWQLPGCKRQKDNKASGHC